MGQALIRLLIVTSVCMASAGVARALSYADSEFLPAFCRHTKDGERQDPAAKRDYERLFGAAFNHMHHYCRGLWALHEASQITDNQLLRDGKYKRATVEFGYVLARSDESFVLRPEILVKKGMALLAIDSDVEAIKCFRDALSLRPDYVPAYVALSNHLKRIGEKAEARRVLEAGLRQVPDNEFLRRKLGELSDYGSTEHDGS